ncbi:MAG: hypothetical protein RMZ41_012290 [Nostoc sp. DedVER02]|uniref:hypothetical protein n=1 Tax=unclassified Nostoc TaxID=2593658 RepID=UPI002AD3D7E8|nr:MULTISPECIES: hypothetical protein [unclassified Nostoc]MDZ7984985.1 hypothetical protein [Nostoc sp. DedVER02]MDZ8114127.1 hypothetical protein [Nostoc sp. DedVER01b]
MKITNLINSVLIVACVAFAPVIVDAQTVNNNNSGGQINTNSSNTRYLQPFNVAFLAYQGAFKEQGIPSAGTLLSEFQIGNLTAKDVVQAAIKANKLPAKVLNDRGYVNAVDSQLTSMINGYDIGS